MRPANSEVERLVCDNALMHSLTGHMPQHSLRDGLLQTIEWLKKPENFNQYKVDQFNVCAVILAGGKVHVCALTPLFCLSH